MVEERGCTLTNSLLAICSTASLSLGLNDMTGSIPSEIALMTNLGAYIVPCIMIPMCLFFVSPHVDHITFHSQRH